jgi:hypothetical protein
LTGDPVFRLLLRVAVGAVAILVLTTTYADPDLWGHVRFGLDIVTSRAIHTEDPYSFTSDRPWINHEWLAEAAMALAYRAGGSIGLVVLRIALVAAAWMVVWRSLRRRSSGWGADPILLLVIVGTAWVTVSVRPQLFSVLLFSLLLASILRVEQGSRQALWWWPALMMVWVNAHGGWLVGLGMLGLWTAFAIPDAAPRDRALLLGACAAAALATLVNPYGIGMWRFLAETVRLGRDIAEWQPITSHPWSHVVMWGVTFTIAIAAGVRGARVHGAEVRGAKVPGAQVRSAYPAPRTSHLWAHFAMAAALAFASWRVARLDAFFCLAVAMLLAPRLVPVRGAAAERPASPTGPVWIVVAVSAVVILWPVAVRARTQLPCIEIEGEWPPDAEATEFIARERLRGRMLTWFDWGEYAIWHFGPALQVSMDGRRETVYSPAAIAAHFAFYRDQPGGRDLPRSITPDYLWLPRTLPVVPRLAEDGWQPLFESARSIVFAPSAEKVYRTGGPEPPSRRCFPGP